MTRLTQVAITTRKIIRYSIYFVIFLIVGRIVLNIGIGIFNILFPKPPPAPTVSFGKLPKLPFPEKTSPTFTYQVQTADGELPVFANQAKVFFMPKPSSSFASLDSTIQKASSLGFPSAPQKISDTTYRFTNRDNTSTLEINIINGSFSISYNLAADPSPLSVRPPAPEIAASNVKSYLTSGGVLPDDLTGPTSNVFLKIQGQSLVPAVSLSEASLVKVNFFRKAYEEFPAVTADPQESNVWFLVSGLTQREKQIVAAQFHYFLVDEQQSSTYPIKTTQEALQELQNNGAYIASTGVGNTGSVTIRKIYLGYYDPGTPASFYQPVFVFEGDRGFMAYVPAVTGQYYGD